MQNDRRCLLGSLVLLLVAAACNSSDDRHRPEEHTKDAGTQDVQDAPAPLTYWQDIVPIFEQHCLQCHREGGIAPFRLDDYASAKPFTLAIAHATSERTMPPWAVTSDGSCGDFAGSLALSDDDIERIAQWASNGAPEGAPAKVEVPELPTLHDATEVTTPKFFPVAQGTKLSENDEYRCFALDLPEGTNGYVTGYDVQPGNSEIVHHLAGFIIDPDAQAQMTDDAGNKLSTMTNRERMQALHDESPDREGWPCFGAAGDGVDIDSAFVVWAPGQGVVNYPKGTGVPIEPRHQLVVQIHYNLSDIKQRGTSDQTRVRLRVEKDVEEIGIFVTEDPLLTSIYEDEPDTLPPHQASTKYSWKRSAKDMDMGDLKTAKFYGIMPHMHGLGRQYQLMLTQEGKDPQCAAQVDNWNFHWQRLYFYQEPYIITPETQFEVTCNYDTSSVTQPVQPGWGTSNEMCLAMLFLSVDKEAYKAFRD